MCVCREHIRYGHKIHWKSHELVNKRPTNTTECHMNTSYARDENDYGSHRNGGQTKNSARMRVRNTTRKQQQQQHSISNSNNDDDDGGSGEATTTTTTTTISLGYGKTGKISRNECEAKSVSWNEWMSEWWARLDSPREWKPSQRSTHNTQ